MCIRDRDSLIKAIAARETHEQLLASEKEASERTAKNAEVEKFITEDRALKAERDRVRSQEKWEAREKGVRGYQEHLRRVGENMAEKDRKAKVLTGFWNDQVSVMNVGTYLFDYSFKVSWTAT